MKTSPGWPHFKRLVQIEVIKWKWSRFRFAARNFLEGLFTIVGEGKTGSSQSSHKHVKYFKKRIAHS